MNDEQCFCGRPYVSLVAHKEKSLCWDANTIGITIHDNDDFDVGLIYETNSENFKDVLHELINWMRDHEQGISYYDDIWNEMSFFPELGCKRRRWQK